MKRRRPGAEEGDATPKNERREEGGGRGAQRRRGKGERERERRGGGQRERKTFGPYNFN